MSDVLYELKHPFEYSKGSQQEKAGFISIDFPSYKAMPRVMPIQQAFTAAATSNMPEVSSDDKASGEKGEPITAEGVIMVMSRWDGDMVKVMLHFEELVAGNALVDGDTKLTKPLIEKMSFEDMSGFLGEYVANFIAPSLLNG